MECLLTVTLHRFLILSLISFRNKNTIRKYEKQPDYFPDIPIPMRQFQESINGG